MKRKNLFKLMSFILTLAVLCGCSEKTPEKTSSSNEDQSNTETSTSEDISSSSESDEKTEYEFVKAPEGFSKSIIYSYDDYYITNTIASGNMHLNDYIGYSTGKATYKEFIDSKDAVLLKVRVGGENIDCFNEHSNGLPLYKDNDGRPEETGDFVGDTIVPCYIEEVLYGGKDFDKSTGDLIYIKEKYGVYSSNNYDAFRENLESHDILDLESTEGYESVFEYYKSISEKIENGKDVVETLIYPMIYGKSYLIILSPKPTYSDKYTTLVNGMPDFYFEDLFLPYDPISMGKTPKGEEFDDHSAEFIKAFKYSLDVSKFCGQMSDDYGYLFGIETNAVTSSEQ